MSCTNCARNTGDIRTDKPFPLKIGARVRGADQGDGWTQARSPAPPLHGRSVTERRTDENSVTKTQ